MTITLGGKRVPNVTRRVAYPHALPFVDLGSAEMEVPGTRTWGNMDVRTKMSANYYRSTSTCCITYS